MVLDFVAMDALNGYSRLQRGRKWDASILWHKDFAL